MPFRDATFDAVVSQFGLTFFEDRREALKEMWRVLWPGGRLAVAVWDELEHSPGYAAMAGLLQRLFGDDVAGAMRAPFSLGDLVTFQVLFTEAGIPDVQVRTQDGTARFPSLEAWVHTDIKGWTLAEMIDDGQYRQLLDAAESDLASYVQADGTVVFTTPAHIVSAAKT